MIRVVDDIFMDDSEIKEEFIRSGGPGGRIRKACERPKRRVRTKPSRAKREKRAA